ncbi:hypothetical protein [Sulfoacidibacillus thermotolerans]|uniref:Uncharacterized protein n=1 Tax=Sulfoacidibacillus thermotolerans TaxID=1765684 RepID=A0A2U3D6V6_SULT2|nr:hypothetical protein [Sulfoacidibacillus thermotolerans]PWI57020.1 hypothetical protein BM613_10690 [Sulfoacidibacillus thermotolerans]
MARHRRILAPFVSIGVLLTLLIAAMVTHNSANETLTLAQVLTVAIIPFLLLGLAAVVLGD